MCVSILVPALNERDNILDCISSLRWSDDIVVVDSGSTDGSIQMAEAAGARVEQFRYVPGGPKKKNWALANLNFKHDWVLIVDADERIPNKLFEEILSTIQSPANSHSGFYVNRRFMFMGQWIKHAGYFPSWNLRLFRLGAGRYELIPDYNALNGDNEVHEHVILNGSAGYLRAPMDHFAFKNVRSFVEKHNRYSSWEAEQRQGYLGGAQSLPEISWHLRLRRVLKRIARVAPFPDGARFFYHFILRGGWLDGRAGYVLCRLLADYEFLIWAKTVELKERRIRGPLASREHAQPPS
jgi:glycosyltransferase involved in cell wall biosynthesis